jgi:two-component system phosphate regulon sensor histidine kinase PhoR
MIERQRPLAAEKHVTITGTITPHIRTRGDVPLVRQLMSNLIGNAIKFNMEKGEVRVTLKKDTLVIEDTGIGIAHDALPHIFDRFYQADTSRAKDGFGLGLAFVKRVVDVHGWTIAVKSAKGKGTTFTVKFS